MDKDMTPIRGQTVLVRNECGLMMGHTSATGDGADEMCYMMQRAAGTVLTVRSMNSMILT